MAEEKQIGFRGTVEYRTRLKQEALNRGTNVQGLIEAAVDAYLEGKDKSDSKVSNIYKQQDKKVLELIEILRIPLDKPILKALHSVLEAALNEYRKAHSPENSADPAGEHQKKNAS